MSFVFVLPRLFAVIPCPSSALVNVDISVKLSSENCRFRKWRRKRAGINRGNVRIPGTVSRFSYCSISQNIPLQAKVGGHRRLSMDRTRIFRC